MRAQRKNLVPFVVGLQLGETREGNEGQRKKTRGGGKKEGTTVYTPSRKNGRTREVDKLTKEIISKGGRILRRKHKGGGSLPDIFLVGLTKRS